jgi:Domain of unknown function (DUF4386)
MAADVHTTAGERLPMSPMRKTALVAGGLYLLTFVASIPALGLKGPALHNVDFILGHGSETSVLLAGFLDVVTALAGIGTAIALFPVAKRQSEGAALGFAISRGLEAAMIVVGVVSLLTLVTLRQDFAGVTGTDATSLVTTGRSLVAMHNWTFLLGPGVMPAINAFFLGTVMYRSRLVPRIIPTMGLIGAPLLLISSTATLFGVFDQVSTAAFVLALPIAAWEFSLGVWLVVKGFNPSPIIEEMAAENEMHEYRSLAA